MRKRDDNQQRRAMAGRCLLLIGALVAAVTGFAQASVSELLSAGSEAVQSGDLASAERAYSGVLELEPGNDRALFELGQLRYGAGAFIDAEDLFRRAAAVRPESFPAQLMLGAALLQQGKRNQATAPLETAHSLRPAQSDAGKLLSIEYLAQARYRDAVKVLRRLVDASSADQEIYLLIIEAYHRAGEADSSLQLAEIAVEAFPDSPRLNCWLGFQLGRNGRFVEAKAAVRRAIERDASYEPSFYVMGEILVEQGESQEAIGYLQKAASMNSQDVETRVLLGRALAGADRFAEALDELQHAAELNPSNPDVHLELSRVYLRLGDSAKSREAADRFREMRRNAAPPSGEIPARLGFEAAQP